MEETDIPEGAHYLTELENRYRDGQDVHDTADVVVLLVATLAVCGVSDLGGFTIGWTFTVIRVDCALSFFILAHEVGHLMGLDHDNATLQEAHQKPRYSFAMGYLVDQGESTDKRGFHTIMAYPRKNHEVAIPYFSDPYIIFGETKTHIGAAYVADNVRALLINRYKLSIRGDESSKTCRGWIITDSADKRFGNTSLEESKGEDYKKI